MFSCKSVDPARDQGRRRCQRARPLHHSPLTRTAGIRTRATDLEDRSNPRLRTGQMLILLSALPRSGPHRQLVSKKQPRRPIGNKHDGSGPPPAERTRFRPRASGNRPTTPVRTLMIYAWSPPATAHGPRLYSPIARNPRQSNASSSSRFKRTCPDDWCRRRCDRNALTCIGSTLSLASAGAYDAGVA